MTASPDYGPHAVRVAAFIESLPTSRLAPDRWKNRSDEAPEHTASTIAYSATRWWGVCGGPGHVALTIEPLAFPYPFSEADVPVREARIAAWDAAREQRDAGRLDQAHAAFDDAHGAGYSGRTAAVAAVAIAVMDLIGADQYEPLVRGVRAAGAFAPQHPGHRVPEEWNAALEAHRNALAEYKQASLAHHAASHDAMLARYSDGGLGVARAEEHAALDAARAAVEAAVMRRIALC